MNEERIYKAHCWRNHGWVYFNHFLENETTTYPRIHVTCCKLWKFAACVQVGAVCQVNRTYFDHRSLEHEVGSLEAVISKLIKNWDSWQILCLKQSGNNFWFAPLEALLMSMTPKNECQGSRSPSCCWCAFVEDHGRQQVSGTLRPVKGSRKRFQRISTVFRLQAWTNFEALATCCQASLNGACPFLAQQTSDLGSCNLPLDSLDVSDDKLVWLSRSDWVDGSFVLIRPRQLDVTYGSLAFCSAWSDFCKSTSDKVPGSDQGVQLSFLGCSCASYPTWKLYPNEIWLLLFHSARK